MSSIFRKKNKYKIKENDVQEKYARSIVSTCIRYQRKWAYFMQRYTERLSHNTKLAVFTLYCLLWGSLSTYLIANSIMSRRVSSLSIVQVKAFPYSFKSGEEGTKSSVFITKAEYERIERFRFYMDSLARSPSDKTVYDSIISQRPELMDSVALLENIYQSQLKK